MMDTRQLLLLLLFASVLGGCSLSETQHDVSTPLGETAETMMALPERARLTFPLRIERVQVRDNRYNDILLRIELIRAGRRVGDVECTAYRGTSRNAGRGIVVFQNECALTVPSGGADTVRIRPTFRENHGGTQVTGLFVGVRVARSG